MTAAIEQLATEQLRELVDACDAPDPPPLSAELVRTLDLPADLPAELAIGDVAEATGVSAHTLRYYERIGLVEVGRDTGGRRVYDRQALARVVFVTRLRKSDMPIRDIARYLVLVRQGETSVPARLSLMQAHRESIPATAAGAAGRAGRHRLQDRHVRRELLTMTPIHKPQEEEHDQHHTYPSAGPDSSSQRWDWAVWA